MQCNAHMQFRHLQHHESRRLVVRNPDKTTSFVSKRLDTARLVDRPLAFHTFPLCNARKSLWNFPLALAQRQDKPFCALTQAFCADRTGACVRRNVAVLIAQVSSTHAGGSVDPVGMDAYAKGPREEFRMCAMVISMGYPWMARTCRTC